MRLAILKILGNGEYRYGKFERKRICGMMDTEIVNLIHWLRVKSGGDL